MPAEAKVGIFFVIALLLVAFLVFFLGDFGIRSSSYQVTAFFDDIQGLPTGSEVRLAGVRVGKVTDVSLQSHPDFIGRPAAVTMLIRRDVMLYSTDVFNIQQGAIIGDKYVDILRGEGTPRKKLGHQSLVAGGEVGGLTQVTDEVRALIAEAQATMIALRTMLVTEYNQEKIGAILANVESATRTADAVATQALGMVRILNASAAEFGPNVVAITDNLQQASISVKNTAALVQEYTATSSLPHNMETTGRNIRDASADVKAMTAGMREMLTDPEMRKQVEDALANLNKASGNLAAATEEADRLIRSVDVSDDLKASMANLRESSEHVRRITAHAEELITDPKLSEDIRETVAGAREATTHGAEAAEMAKQSLDRVDRTMDNISEITRSIKPTAVLPRASLQGARHEGLRAVFDVDLQYGEKPNNFWRLGVYDLGDSERLNLQRSISFGSSKRARFGLFASKLGLGYDIGVGRRFGMEFELWDPNELHYNVRGVYDIGHSTDLLLGIQDVGEGTDEFIGIRRHLRRSP